MGTTTRELWRWLSEGKRQGATHMIVACDVFAWEDFPVYVLPGESTREKAREHTKIMEVYSLSKDWDEQLQQHRVWNWD